MLYPTMPGPTAPAAVKNSGQANDSKAGGRAAGKSGFSDLLAREMDVQQTSPGTVAAADDEAKGKGVGEPAAVGQVPEGPKASSLPADASDAGSEPSADHTAIQAVENFMPLNRAAAAAEAERAKAGQPEAARGEAPGRGRGAVSPQPDTQRLSLATETRIKGTAQPEIEEGEGQRDPVDADDEPPARSSVRPNARHAERDIDQSVLPVASLPPEIAIAPERAAAVAAATMSLAPIAAGGTRKDGAIAPVDGPRATSDYSREAAETGGTSRAFATGRPSAVRVDTLFRLDSSGQHGDFRQMGGALQSLPFGSETGLLRKSLPDLSPPALNPSFLPVELPAASLIVDSGPTSTASAAIPGLPADTAYLEPRPGSAGWDNALGQKVLWMASQQQQVAELTLNPPDLGPLQVVLSITNDEATATFVSQHADVRQALEAALPRLKEMMAESGITLNSATVSQEGAGQQSGFDRQDRSGGQHGGRTHAAMPEVSTGTSRILVEPGRSRLVDTFA
jgi:flagellar hook-length control protein FliK